MLELQYPQDTEEKMQFSAFSNGTYFQCCNSSSQLSPMEHIFSAAIANDLKVLIIHSTFSLEHLSNILILQAFVTKVLNFNKYFAQPFTESVPFSIL